MPAIRQRAAFTLSDAVKSELEARVPKSRRSRFVEEAIAKALMTGAREKALAALEALPTRPVRDAGSVEILRRIRDARSLQLASAGQTKPRKRVS